MAASPEPGPLLAGTEAKQCCASLYESEPVRWLIGDYLHPGGAALSLHAATAAGVGAGTRVLDVASGGGATALLLARELDAVVTGIDYGTTSVAGARARAAADGFANEVSFVHGDAESLPFAAGSFDAVLCECSLCTFPDKDAAVGEIARVLRPGGRLALADVTASLAELPSPLQSAAAQVACIADTLPLAGYLKLVEGADLEIIVTESHDDALGAMIDRVEARLRAARILGGSQLGAFGDQVEQGIELARLAGAELGSGRLGYHLIVARRPAPPSPGATIDPPRRSSSAG